MALDGGGTAGVPPPIPPPSKLMTTPKSVFEPPRSLGTPGESLVMILATSGPIYLMLQFAYFLLKPFLSLAVLNHTSHFYVLVIFLVNIDVSL